MPQTSRDSSPDFDRIQERIQHTDRDPTPDADANRHAEADFAHVGAAFDSDRRYSLSRPNSIVLSEIGEPARQHESQIAFRNRVLSEADDVMAGNRVSGRSPAPPIPTQHPLGSFLQLSDLPQIREQRGRGTRRRRRHNRGPGSHSSTSTSERRRRDSETLNDDDGFDDEDDDLGERGRSRTPTQHHTPYIPQSYTPSHHSLGTEEDHGEGQAPMSPNPWSPDQPYNADQRHRTEALANIDEHFPADQQSWAE
ncbi:hypothetical protein BU23DRAFT_569917 [Bimuria novae-zelandiae CBS 107.79]|uniref:Uncharacterized protein n=1 Tax=Bimuria novae-zelandiae CBS 107.79 TaxID=1447943 RepID=A0A6A5V8R4_9PLEO|nr:hypothetical protein BU23DRAFT_569917 [Bimuria novae-zelandiae CBS 107.79]